MSEMSLLRNPAVLEQDLGEELLLYTAGGESVHVLNATGRAVWQSYDGQRSVEEIAHLLRSSFAHTDECNVVADVQQMIAALIERQLLME